MPAVLGQINAQHVIPKGVLFELMGYKAYAPEVVAFHSSDAPVRIVSAPARTSKSYSAAAEIIALTFVTVPRTNSLTWIIGPDYQTNKEFQYVFETLVDRKQELFPDAHSISRAVNNPGNGAMEIILEWPRIKPTDRICRAIYQGKSASNEKSLQGEEATVACLSEAAELQHQIWSKYISTRYWRALLPTTPKPKAEWIREMSEEGEKDTSLGIESFVFPKEANPYYNFDRHERERKRAASRSPTGRPEDDPYYAEQFLGQWVYYTGLVLPFNPKRHVFDVNPAWLEESRIFVSCDYGYEDACVANFFAVLPSGALLIFDEVHERRLSTQAFVEKVIEKLGPLESRLDYATGDPQEPQVAHFMRELGLPVIAIDKKAQRDRAAGHRRIVDLLSDDLRRGHPMLFVGSNCRHTIAEWKTLHYREGHTNEYGSTSISKDDHHFDAVRYGVMTRPEPTIKEEERDWLREIRRRNIENSEFAGQMVSHNSTGNWRDLQRAA